jgi:hypothetical protein
MPRLDSTPGAAFLFPGAAKGEKSLPVELKIFFDQVERRLQGFGYTGVGMFSGTGHNMIKLVGDHPA